MKNSQLRVNKKLQPPNLCKDIPGKMMICYKCKKPGGTLKKEADGTYYHYPNCPNEPSEAMKKKLEELKDEDEKVSD